MMKQMCDDFVNNEITPILDRIDEQEEGLMQSIMHKAGELGLLGVSVPEELNGMGMDFKTTMLCTETLGAGHSFSVAYGAHTGIGTLPALYYGNEEQKKQFVSKLSTGEWFACYCLTEPNSGSDANSGKTKATLTEDGKHYKISGQKMWITNAGFADVFTVFAKIEDDENYRNSETKGEINWGVIIKADDDGTSDRTLWGSGDRAPIYLIIASKAILLTIWGALIYVVIQIFRLKKYGSFGNKNK